MSRSLTEDDRRDIQWMMRDVTMNATSMALLGGSFIIGFGRSIGGNEHWVGLVSSIPNFMGLLQFVGAVSGRRQSSYKHFVKWTGGLGRLAYLPLFLLPLMTGLGSSRLALILLMMAVSVACYQMGDATYNDWTAEIVPDSHRVAFFGRRAAMSAMVSAAVGIAAGAFLDQMKARGYERAGFSAVFALGFVFTVVSYYFFNRMKDRHREVIHRGTFRQALEGIIEPVRDRVFAGFLRFMCFWVFGHCLMGAQLTSYSINILHLPYSVLNILGLCQGAGQLAVTGMWGRLSERFGNKPCLSMLAVGLCMSPMFWFFLKPDALVYNLPILVFGHIFSGFVWGGVWAIQTNLLFRTAPAEARANYIAAYNTLNMVVMAISPLVGTVILTSVQPRVGIVNGYTVLLGATCICRLLSGLWLFGVHEHGATPVRHALKAIGETPVKELHKIVLPKRKP